MFLRQTVCSVLILCSCLISCYGQHPALAQIDTVDLKKHLSYLASDKLQGRKLGTEVSGLDSAANYLAKQAQVLGLKPSSPDFFQNIKTKSFPFDAKNVVGIVEGRDSVLKHEYVVFMAHYDHLGVGRDGDVYNGADDNGSGTVALLELAQAFCSLTEKPKRSIVFLWLSCEEIGHVGARYYCSNPIYPLEKTIAAINLDMVGRVYESPRDDVFQSSPKKVKDYDGLYVLSNNISKKLDKINAEKCKTLDIIPDYSLPKSRFLRASDHYHFHKMGVPVLNYSTGYHADFHKASDELDRINFDKIRRVSNLCFLVGIELANL